MKVAQAYEVGGRVIVTTCSRSPDRILVTVPPAYEADYADTDRIGDIVLRALDASGDTPLSQLTKGLFDHVLKSASAKTWSAFARKARYVLIDSDGDHVVCRPQVYEPGSRGYSGIKGVTLTVPARVHDVGECVKRAFRLIGEQEIED